MQALKSHVALVVRLIIEISSLWGNFVMLQYPGGESEMFWCLEGRVEAVSLPPDEKKDPNCADCVKENDDSKFPVYLHDSIHFGLI